jgi:hypothetical protein
MDETPEFKHLIVGRRYAVIAPFTDYDGKLREAGETFTYLGHNFLPYEDGLTLNIDPGVSIRLQWRAEAQAGVIDALERYIGPI